MEGGDQRNVRNNAQMLVENVERFYLLNRVAISLSYNLSVL